jgi:hypothetical protein
MSKSVIQGYFVGGQMRATPGVLRPEPVQRKAAPGAPVPAFAALQRPAAVRHAGAGIVQRHGGDGSFDVDPVRLGLARTGGSPLPAGLLAKMEGAFGADFSAVRVHVGPQASRIGAIAFTTGNDLYFAPGRYQPESVQGQQLLGHELAHVIQQRQGRVRAASSGVAVVQDRMLEAEADRLGMRAAAWRAPTLRPGAAGAGVARPGAAGAVQRSPSVHDRLQRMEDPGFPVTFPAIRLFNQHQDTEQDDLEGNSKKRGRKDHRDKQHFNAVKRQKYVHAGGKDSHGKTHGAGVVSYIKFNGSVISFGENEKAHTNLVFHDIGYENQRGVKDNFHAEDWSIASFKSKYDKAKPHYDDMDDWLHSIGFPSTGNSGQGGRHVISILINYSSCLGCVTTIRQFYDYLVNHLKGANKFLLRVKFLRPYDLAQTLRDPESQAAKNFISGIGGLREKGIFVRMQSEQSARHMLGKTVDPGILTTIAVNHPGVKRVLDADQYSYLTQTWTQLGANRKGALSRLVANTIGFTFTAPVSLPPISVVPMAIVPQPLTAPSPFAPNFGSPSVGQSGPYLCGAPTTKGTACGNKVSKPGLKCHRHRN